MGGDERAGAAGPAGAAADPALGRLLAKFLHLRRRELVAFVGAGGKTTLLLALGAELRDEGRRVLLTTTTRVGADQVAAAPGFWFERREDAKLIGPSADAVDRAWNAGDHDVVLVEADGARRLLAKAPASHEPVVPSMTTVVVGVIAADALGGRIDEVAHRPDLVAGVVGCEPNDVLTPERAAALADSPAGLRKSVPPASRFVVAVTRMGAREEPGARRLADLLQDRGVRAVVLPRREA